MLTDLSEDQLHEYRSTQQEPTDFDAFWSGTLAESRAAAAASAPVVLERVDLPLHTVEVHDVTFPGFGGQPIKGWLRVPAGATGPLPTVVQYIGYGGGRARPWENLLWASAGYAHLQMDTRGQGARWSAGATGDASASDGPQVGGVMTRGIDSPGDYYYRRLITDAVRAVDAARTLDVVDSQRIGVFGNSQGGGLSLAVAGLVPEVRAVAAAVPFLSDFPRAIRVTDSYPYREIADYLAVHREKVGQVLDTLAYFDTVNFAPRASAPAWFTAALMDPVTPPSTVFGAYHRYAGPKSIQVWPFNGHESGQADDELRILSFFGEHLRG